MPQDKNNQDKPKEKTIGDKIIDIIHSVTSNAGGETKDDPVSGVIKKASDESLIGGGRRKRKIDEAESDAVGK